MDVPLNYRRGRGGGGGGGGASGILPPTVGRWALLRLVQQISGDDDTGAPSRGVVILCLLMTLVSAWVTDFIGIDAIFGAFVAGIIVPREHRSILL